MKTPDVTIIGGGPAGLSFARALAPTGVNITILERQSEEELKNAGPDGRDIALTHLSIKILQDLDIWTHIPEDEVSPLRHARVLNGNSPHFLGFDPPSPDVDKLGVLIPNYLIRRAAYMAIKKYPNIHLVTNVVVTDLETNDTHASITTKSGDIYTSKLLVAADSRFSDARRKMGIGADMRDFGRTVIVCRARHEDPEFSTAYEYFIDDRTLAVLPLNNQLASIVVTIPTEQTSDLMGMSVDDFSKHITDQFGGRIGDMMLIGERYPYPLVAVYADRFVAKRFALMGDAAVGMHPVTAHGFNFGLRGADDLARRLADTLSWGGDIGSAPALDAYERQHRQATYPLYIGTNKIVTLFTKTDPLAWAIRGAAVRLGAILPFVKTKIARGLTEIPKKSVI